MRHLDLFSGIGGFALAARWAGMETVAFVEKDPYCQKVLEKHWPGVDIYGDIKEFDGIGYWGAVDIITGGFPCQPFSIAGKRRGKEDDRDLWPEMLRVIHEVRPTWIIGENVANFVSMELERTIIDLEAEDYEVQPLIIPACGVNAPHQRYRVWIIANTGRTHGQGNIHPRGNAIEDRQGNAYQIKRSNTLHVTNPNNQGSQRLWQYGERGNESSFGAGTWEEPWPEVATRLCRVDDGVSHRVHRLKALGNAIVPQVAYQILKHIMEIENEPSCRLSM